MKRAKAAACIAALILIVPLLCFAGGTGFRHIPGTSGALKQYDGRRQAYYGPGSGFAGAGGFKPNEVISATALFREGDFIYVELAYQGMVKRCVYFSASNLENSSAGFADLNTPRSASLLSAVQPVLGPGEDFSLLEQKTENNVRQPVRLQAGAEIQALAQMNGWVFAEFSCAVGRVRAWVPAGQVQCGEDICAVTLDVSVDSESRKPVFAGLPSAENVPQACPVCGGVRTAVLTISYMQFDEQYHIYGPMEADECANCHRQFILGAKDAPKEPHEFENGTCVSCGFVKGSGIPCAECAGTMIPMDEYRAVPCSDESHSIEHYRYYECRKCGYATDPVPADSQGEERHQYDADGNCIYCMYHNYGN